MLSVGLTGGIGAGKSAVAQRLVAHGAALIDSDVVAREVVAAGTSGLADIEATFGPGVLAPDGTLDRLALGAIVFGDQAARRRLESITHPRVRARSAELAAAAPPGAIVVHDVPLLVEVGLASTYHLVVVVEADRDVRVARLVHDRGMTADQATARIAAQADDARRRAAADILLRNDHTLADLHRAVDTHWPRLREYAHHLHAATTPDPPLAVVPPDPRWPAAAARLAARLRYALGDLPVAHVGPTAVPGLAAPDILDIQVGVASSEAADGLAPRLAALGLPALTADPAGSGAPAPADGAAAAPDAASGEWAAERVHGSADPGRAVRLRLPVIGSPTWRSALLLRDHLRADPAARDVRAEFERERAAALDGEPWDAVARRAWLDQARAAAERWASETGWTPPSS